MKIIHGDNIVKSRKQLADFLESATEQNKNLIKLDAKNLTLANLQESLVSHDLFGIDQLVIIEELHSLITSARKKSLIDFLKDSKFDHIILWEKRSLTKKMLSNFTDAQVYEFKSSNVLYQWLESLGSGQPLKNKLEKLHQAVDQEAEHFCFLMLIRQIRMLIQIKDSGKLAGPPFLVSKLKSQANFFNFPRLLDLHEKLLAIDINYKTSQNRISLRQELDLITISL